MIVSTEKHLEETRVTIQDMAIYQLFTTTTSLAELSHCPSIVLAGTETSKLQKRPIYDTPT